MCKCECTSLTDGTPDSDELFAHMRSHANFAALSLVLPWGLAAELDELQHASLALSPPSVPLSLAMRGEDGMLSVMVPAARRDEARWTTSPHFTAIYSATPTLTRTWLPPLTQFSECIVLRSHVFINYTLVCSHAHLSAPRCHADTYVQASPRRRLPRSCCRSSSSSLRRSSRTCAPTRRLTCVATPSRRWPCCRSTGATRATK